MGSVNIGFIGCGAVSELHYPGLAACPQAKLVCLHDTDRAKLQQRMNDWRVPGYDSLEAFLQHDGLDAVFVLSPLPCHFGHVTAALRAGKHVLVEKPVASDAGEMERMQALARQTGLVCMPAHNYIYMPEVVRLKKNISQGNLGHIAVSWMMFHIHHDQHMQARYPGVIRQIGTHLLYTHRFLFGEPAGLSAHKTSFLYPELQREDQVMMTLPMPDGSLSNLFASFAVSDHTSSPWTFVIKVLGSRGSSHISWQDVVFDRELGTLSRSYGKYEESYECEIDYFINRCIAAGEEPLSTLEDAGHVLKLVQLAEASAESHRLEGTGG